MHRNAVPAIAFSARFRRSVATLFPATLFPNFAAWFRRFRTALLIGSTATALRLLATGATFRTAVVTTADLSTAAAVRPAQARAAFPVAANGILVVIFTAVLPFPAAIRWIIHKLNAGATVSFLWAAVVVAALFARRAAFRRKVRAAVPIFPAAVVATTRLAWIAATARDIAARRAISATAVGRILTTGGSLCAAAILRILTAVPPAAAAPGRTAGIAGGATPAGRSGAAGLTRCSAASAGFATLLIPSATSIYATFGAADFTRAAATAIRRYGRAARLSIGTAAAR